MRLQTHQEFNQNEIMVNVEYFNSKLNEGHAVGAEQKIRELKENLSVLKNPKIYFEASRSIKKGHGKYEHSTYS